jgi:hypothetical protein
LQGEPLLRQRKTHKNRDVFVLLVNKSPLRRIVEITGLNPGASRRSCLRRGIDNHRAYRPLDRDDVAKGSFLWRTAGSDGSMTATGCDRVDQ